MNWSICGWKPWNQKLESSYIKTKQIIPKTLNKISMTQANQKAKSISKKIQTSNVSRVCIYCFLVRGLWPPMCVSSQTQFGDQHMVHKISLDVDHCIITTSDQSYTYQLQNHTTFRLLPKMITRKLTTTSKVL